MTRLYFRRGEIRRSLRSPDGSEELRAEVAEIVLELSRQDSRRAVRAGTVGGALREYVRSADFLDLARSTQASYQRLIDELVEDAGDVLLSEVTPPWVNEMKDAWAPRGHRAANLRLQMLINGLRRAMIDGRVPGDPFLRLRKVKRPHDAPEPNPAWTDEEVQAVIDLALTRGMPGLARAVGLGRWGGFRRGTICALPLNARVLGYDAEGDAKPRLYWLTEKRRVICDKPEDDRLTALIASTPSAGLTIAYNARGRPWQPRQLNQALDRIIDALASSKTVRGILTLHGLRHARGVELATAGASDSEIMSQLEHADSRTAQIYRRQAERRTMANAGQAKIDEVRRRRRQRMTAPSTSDRVAGEGA